MNKKRGLHMKTGRPVKPVLRVKILPIASVPRRLRQAHQQVFVVIKRNFMNKQFHAFHFTKDPAEVLNSDPTHLPYPTSVTAPRVLPTQCAHDPVGLLRLRDYLGRSRVLLKGCEKELIRDKALDAYFLKMSSSLSLTLGRLFVVELMRV